MILSRLSQEGEGSGHYTIYDYAALEGMGWPCQNKTMKEITVQQLHEETERWVKQAADNGGILITEEGKPVAKLETVAVAKKGKPLPDREEKIRRRPYNPVDSAAYISEDRDRF